MRQSRVIVAVVIGLMALGMLGPVPASASASVDERCPFSDALCLFDGEGYTGERFTVTTVGSQSACVDLEEHGWAERARSAINTSLETANMFQLSTDCSGYGAPIYSGRTPNFSGWFSPISVRIY